MRENKLFYICLILTSIGLLALYVFKVTLDGSIGLLFNSVFYLAALGTLFFGWKLIDHKFPGKGEKK